MILKLIISSIFILYNLAMDISNIFNEYKSCRKLVYVSKYPLQNMDFLRSLNTIKFKKKKFWLNFLAQNAINIWRSMPQSFD
jgi:hypothetical protein